MPVTAQERLTLCLYLVFNVISVVGVVAVNKMLYNAPYNFRFPSTLMVFHFFCTWLFVVGARCAGWFESKRIETSSYVKLGLAQAGSVGFVNLSLMLNKVGMYQLLKFTNVLVIAAMEFFWKGKTYSGPIYISLVALVAGVTVATVSDVAGTPLGVFYGCLASLSTAVYQILNKSIQTDFEVKSMQLLEYEQPFTALWSVFFAFFTDDLTALAQYEFNMTNSALLLLSGFFAFGVNVTCYLIIGKSSPVTYSVVGHVKTVGILVFGLFVLKEQMEPKTAFGLAVAFCAIVAYTHLTTVRSQAVVAKDRDELRGRSPNIPKVPTLGCGTATTNGSGGSCV